MERNEEELTIFKILGLTQRREKEKESHGSVCPTHFTTDIFLTCLSNFLLTHSHMDRIGQGDDRASLALGTWVASS